jgi:ribosomal protein S18 acetylase RimI-like enzyme
LPFRLIVSLTRRNGFATLAAPRFISCGAVMSDLANILPLPGDASSVNRFLRLAYHIYEGDPHWVAPLLMDQKKVFTKANPLFQHAEMQLWVASRNGRDVGRIAAILDQNYQGLAKVPTAFFGFYECEDNPETSRQLFQTAVDWARSRNCEMIMGPMNPTTNDECGLLVEGFDSSPVIMMTYNPAYYVPLVERAGFVKSKDLLAFEIAMAGIPMERLLKIGSKVKARNPDVKLRPLLRKTLLQDLDKVKQVYNEAWQANWGFVPMTDPEVDFMADRLKPLLMEGLVWLAEVGPEPVGFLLALPDFNVPLKPLRGKVVTPALAGFLPYLLGWKRPHGTRVITLGVKEKFRGRGLETAMLIEGLKVGFDAGFKVSEASWILEDNFAMIRILEAIGGKPYKRYRIYERDLSNVR